MGLHCRRVMAPRPRALLLAFLSIASAAIVSRIPVQAQDAAPRASSPVSFNREILPILSNNCFACHGPDEKQRETKFHFDTQDGAVREEGRHRPGQRGGEPARPAHHQPGSGRADAAARLRARADRRSRSICCAAGSTRARSGTRTGPTSPPKRARAAGGRARRDWVRNPIDQFILARLEREGLKPSPEADKATLLRRRHLRPDRPAADAGGGRRVPRRPVARRLREARRRAAAVAALRRADGDAVARRRALRRHARLSHRQPARDVAVARLGDRRVQPQHAVRRVHDRAARRRSAARTPRANRRSPPGSTAIT